MGEVGGMQFHLKQALYLEKALSGKTNKVLICQLAINLVAYLINSPSIIISLNTRPIALNI